MQGAAYYDRLELPDGTQEDHVTERADEPDASCRARLFRLDNSQSHRGATRPNRYVPLRVSRARVSSQCGRRLEDDIKKGSSG